MQGLAREQQKRGKEAKSEDYKERSKNTIYKEDREQTISTSLPPWEEQEDQEIKL